MATNRGQRERPALAPGTPVAAATHARCTTATPPASGTRAPRNVGRLVVPGGRQHVSLALRARLFAVAASYSRTQRRVGGLVALVVLGTLTSACAPGPSANGGTRFSLQQKGHFQALYDANGQMLRLLQDNDGDGRAEIVVVFGPKGKPERGEMDTDGDGVIDRREHFAPDGTLTQVELMNATSAAPPPEQTPSNDLKPTGDP